MNKGYTYIDGKVIISDENGNHTQTEYYDNLDQVLVHENIIEEIERKIKVLTAKNERYKPKKYIPFYLYAGVGFAALTPLILSILTGTNLYLCDTTVGLGSISDGLIINMTLGMIFLPISSLFEIVNHSGYKQNVNRGNAINSELDFLNLELAKEKKILLKLKKEKTMNNRHSKFESKQVDDKTEMKVLDRVSELNYVLGYFGKKYYHYYEQGKLDKVLKEYYSESEIALAKEYFEVKGPVLAKKKK